MKIVIAADIFFPDIGGPATYSMRLATKLQQLGWDVQLVCYSDNFGIDQYPFAVTRVLRHGGVVYRYWRYFVTLKRLAKNADLIYAQGPVSSGLPAVLAAQLLGKRLVVKVVGDYAWEQARNLNRTEVGIDDFQQASLSGKVALLKRIEIWACKRADQVIVPSQYLKKIVSGWGIDSARISVVHNGISFAEPHADVDSQDPHIIVSIGRLVPWKGFATLIELLPNFLSINENFRLMILGYGPDHDKLIRRARELGVQDHVEIKKVTHQFRDEYLKLAGIFVLNTGYEGLSHTLLEVMAVGVPIVTTTVGGNPEVIVDGENGFLVEFNNKQQLTEAILKLYNDKELRKRFIARGREVLPNFTVDTMLENTVALLMSVVSAALVNANQRPR